MSIQMTTMASNRFVGTLIMIGTLFLGFACAFGQTSARTASDSAPDQYIEMLRADIRSVKKQVIAANLVLTDKEAEKFWPIYDQYTAELTKINDTKVALIKTYAENYSNMTDEDAEEYIKGRAALDESVNRLRLKYFPVFRRVLSGKTTAKFFQIEWRISLVIDLRLASQMPLIQQ